MLTTVCDPEPEVLAACLESVRSQTEPGVEHVLVDDASSDPAVRAVLDTAARGDDRVRLVRRSTRGGIVAAANDALAAASGEFLALLDHDDTLAPAALATMGAAITSSCDLAYSDHDHIRADGRLVSPVFKPDFSPERLRQQNYITHLVTIRRTVAERVSGFRPGFDGSQDHDLLLRVSECAREIVHVPEVLYHWRMAAGSVALDPASKDYAYENGRRAVADHCERLGIDAEVELGAHLGTYRVRRVLRARPTVTLLIGSAGCTTTVWGRRRAHLDALLDSLVRCDLTTAEIIVETPPGCDLATARIDRHVVRSPAAPPYATAADAARGEVGIVLDEAMIVDDPGSLDELVALLTDDVAGVGSAQFHADGCVRHGGFTVHGEPADILFGWNREHPGPGRVMSVAREVSGIDLIGSIWPMTELRAILRRAVGPDTASLGLQASQDAIASGRRVLWTPFASWFRFDCPLGPDGYVAPPRPALGRASAADPYYNVNLVEGRGDWLERPGQAGAPPYALDADGNRRWS